MSNRMLKVLLIGEGNVGKTSLRSRYLNKTFQTAYISTIGADFVAKTVQVSVPVPVYSNTKGKRVAQQTSSQDEPALASSSKVPLHFQEETIRVTLSIWDTAGQERFKSLGSAFYRGADAVIIAFDLTKKDSLARTINWYNDFCRLGDIGYEQQGMNGKQLKRAREQKERFCWVGVGCKGDLLQKLSEESDSKEKVSQWKGVNWGEARGWFDTMIPRLLPEGEEEKQGYPNTPMQGNGEVAALPYTIGKEVPARPEDVLSRPNKSSTSSQPTNGTMEAGVSPGRPAEAGLAPGTAPTPGSSLALRKHSRKSQQRSDSKARCLHEKRKSIRSIEVWQGDRTGSYSSSTDQTGSPTTASTSVPIGEQRDKSQRNRYDSATSVGGTSVYYSVRGSTVFGQSPAGESASSASSSGGKTTSTLMNNGGHQSRNLSLSSQSRIRKQSNLSEVTNDNDEGEDGQTEGISKQKSGSSSETIKGGEDDDDIDGESDKGKSDEFNLLEVDPMSSSAASIPTIPSGDPIPFPSSEDLEDEEEFETPVRRGSMRSKSASARQKMGLAEGELGSKARVIAEETQKAREEDELGDTSADLVNKRTTLYSARPSSMSSTIKPTDEDEDLNLPDSEVDPGVIYRDEMIEQGFRLFFTSAKDDEGIDDVFEHIARRVAMRWKLEEWEEEKEAERAGGKASLPSAPPTDEEVQRERLKRAIKISSGKGTGGCCS